MLQCHPIITRRLDRSWRRSTWHQQACQTRPIVQHRNWPMLPSGCADLLVNSGRSGHRRNKQLFEDWCNLKQCCVSTMRKCALSLERTTICPHSCSLGRRHLPIFHTLHTISIYSDCSVAVTDDTKETHWYNVWLSLHWKWVSRNFKHTMSFLLLDID